MTTDRYSIAMGSYASQTEAGIQVLEFDGETGRLTQIASAAGVLNPSFVVGSEDGHFLYTVSEEGSNGEVVALRLDREAGRLTELNRQPTRGGAPCHIQLDPSGKWLLGVNYMSGSVFVFAIDEDGRIGDLAELINHAGSSVHPKRQESPHTHSIFNIPGTDLWMVCDLGLDKIYVYEQDVETGKLHELSVKDTLPGAGPRHVTFHPKRPFVYVIEELSATLSVFHYDVVSGKLETIQSNVSMLPEREQLSHDGESNGFLAADVHIAVRASGTYLYASLRGHDSLAVYRAYESGKLGLVGHVSAGGKIPRNFLITPDSEWLFVANQNSDSITMMKIGDDGMPTPTGEVYSAKKPVCLTVL